MFSTAIDMALEMLLLILLLENNTLVDLYVAWSFQVMDKFILILKKNYFNVMLSSLWYFDLLRSLSFFKSVFTSHLLTLSLFSFNVEVVGGFGIVLFNIGKVLKRMLSFAWKLFNQSHQIVSSWDLTFLNIVLTQNLPTKT